MAIPPRSVQDATRFTSTVPHASMSSSSPAAAAASSSSSANAPPPSRFQSTNRTSAAAAPSSRRPAGGLTPSRGGTPGSGSPADAASASSAPFVAETPEQKVARLRAAHQAAKNAKVSQLDRVIAGSRRLFDSVHRFTIVGLISFTAIAGVLTAYTAVDMMRYNRQRKAEFLAAQAQMDADGLAAARLAFMRGDASPAQIAQVEAARQAAAEQEGSSSSGGEFFKVPSLLGAPKPAESGAAASVPDYHSQNQSQSLVRAVEDKAASALERERTNQRTGGPLDRIGLEPAAAPSGGKSWWKFW